MYEMIELAFRLSLVVWVPAFVVGVVLVAWYVTNGGR